jgi:hypothetical protein
MKFGGIPVEMLSPHLFVLDPTTKHGSGGVPNDFSFAASALAGANKSRKQAATALAQMILRSPLTRPKPERRLPKSRVTAPLYMPTWPHRHH